MCIAAAPAPSANQLSHGGVLTGVPVDRRALLHRNNTHDLQPLPLKFFFARADIFETTLPLLLFVNLPLPITPPDRPQPRRGMELEMESWPPS